MNGWHRKYDVRRLNDPHGKHQDCEFFVLDLEHDKHASVALLAYADACATDRPELASDLRKRFAPTESNSGDPK